MKKSRSRYNPLLGKLLFIIPAIVIIAVGAYAYVSLNQPGKLIVNAQSPSGDPVSAPAAVNGKSVQTPYTVSLAAGTYTVTYGHVQWYYTPGEKSVSLLPGVTSYAVAVYEPVVRVVTIGANGFNTTSITALHKVTPINFTNTGSSTVAMTGLPFGTEFIGPGRSFTYTFNAAGTYNCRVAADNATVSVVVT